MNNQMMQRTIYVGLNDAETGVQKYDTEKYVSILKKVCKNFHVAFSVHKIDGGYFHEDGRYVEETTLALLLLGTPKATVLEIAKDLCAFFNQESVMVTSSPCSTIFVKDGIWTEEV